MALTKFKTFLEQAPAQDYVPKKDGDEEVKGMEPRSKGERDFKAKHTVKKIGHPAAADKQFKAEEVEQIDELSKDTILSYANKAGKSFGAANVKGAAAASKGDDKEMQKHLDTVRKRVGGMQRLQKRYGEEFELEETEQIDEVEAMGRADFKMSPSGKKVRKLVRFKNTADAAEKERKEKGEE